MNEHLRSFYLGLTGATEGIKWDDHLCFMVCGKMLCISGMNDNSNVSFKVSEEEFEILIEKDGIVPAPYMARNKWVADEKRSALTEMEWQYYLNQSYYLICSKFPKKLKNQFQ